MSTVEQLIVKVKVTGSSPVFRLKVLQIKYFILVLWLKNKYRGKRAREVMLSALRILDRNGTSAGWFRDAWFAWAGYA
jgi:hypothetical protein